MTPSLHRNIKKFYLIYDRLTKLPAYPNLQELKAYLEQHDFEVDERSIQRYLKSFRDEFWIEIHYDKDRNGYVIDKKMSRPDMDKFFHYLSSMYQATILFDEIKDHPKTMNYLQFEHEGLLQGVRWLEELISAIKQRKVLKLRYRKYIAEEPEHYTFHSHLLKEYQGRWYVIGIVEEYNDYRIFGIDRITEIERLKKTFKAKEQQDTSSLFDNIIGLNYSDHDIEKVVLHLPPYRHNTLNHFLFIIHRR